MIIIERHCIPTKYDIEPYGTIAKVFFDDKPRYFIQLGNDEMMDWMPISELMYILFGNLFENKEFVGELLNLHQDCEKTIFDLCDILKSHY